MTKLESMINNVCYKGHEGEEDYENFECDPKEGHYHVEPPPPVMWHDIMYSDHPAEVYGCCDTMYSIEELKELRDWLNIVLVEA